MKNKGDRSSRHSSCLYTVINETACGHIGKAFDLLHDDDTDKCMRASQYHNVLTAKPSVVAEVDSSGGYSWWERSWCLDSGKQGGFHYHPAVQSIQSLKWCLRNFNPPILCVTNLGLTSPKIKLNSIPKIHSANEISVCIPIHYLSLISSLLLLSQI